MGTLRQLVAIGVVAGIGALAPAPSLAGLFSVTPVRIFMAPKDRAIAVTITNEGDDELVMQADIYSWKQKPDGTDDLVLTEDLILAPPIIKLAPRSRQVVRLARLTPAIGGEQQTYRLVVREVPEAKPADKNVQLQIALAFSMPVFVTPPGARPQLDCVADRPGPDVVRATCTNSGTPYAQPREFALTTAAGEKLAARDSGGYLLPSIRRSFEVKRADGRIPGGSAKLAVTLDNGTTQSFDVTIGE